MKLVIVAVLLAAVVGVYGQGDIIDKIRIPIGGGGGGGDDGASDGAGAAGDGANGAGAIGSAAGSAAGGGQKGLSPKEIAQIYGILTRIVGPKIAKLATKLIVVLVNKVLKGLPIKVVVNLVGKLLKPGGILEKILGGGKANAGGGGATQPNGKPKNLTPADRKALMAILNRTVGPYTSKYIVDIVGILLNGNLLGKIPLHALIHGVTGLVGNLLKPNGLLGKLLGQKGLGKPISQLLGAKSGGGQGIAGTGIAA